MKVETVYINTYKYDFHFARICIASVRYWYPEIPIFLIKDFGAGDFDTSQAEKKWGVQIFENTRKNFGWGYGKLEALFSGTCKSFLMLDADTVLTGPVIDKIEDIEAAFIVDDEVQPKERFNEIYYNLDRIKELEGSFVYPGYSFNSGQWFGTSGILTRKDFEKSLNWSDPPCPKFPKIVFNGDQAHLNFILHWKEQLGLVTIRRIKLMVWPNSNNADFLNIVKIKDKDPDYPFIIHWAGMKASKILALPRPDILSFYQDYYYSKFDSLQKNKDQITQIYLDFEKKALYYYSNRLKNFSIFREVLSGMKQGALRPFRKKST